MAQAIGDGANDDTGAINGLINYVSTTYGGGVVVFPNTDAYYKISSALIVPSNITLIGGSGKPFIKTETDDIFNLVEIYNASNIKFISLSFQNGTSSEGDSLGTDKVGIQIDTAENITFDNCYFTEMGGSAAVRVRKTKNIHFKNKCHFYKCTYSMLMLLEETEDIFIDKCIFDTVTSLTAANIYTIATGASDYETAFDFLVRNLHVTKCKLLNNPRWEGFDTHGCKGLYFEDNYLENVGVGVMACFSDSPNVPFEHGDIYILNNIIKKGASTTNGNGIVVQGSDKGLANNVHIKGNGILGAFGSATSTSTAGICLNNVVNFEVDDNITNGCQNKAFVAGFTLYGNVDNNKFLNTSPSSTNVIRPVQFSGGCYHVGFDKNTIKNAYPLSRVEIGVFNNVRGLIYFGENNIDATTDLYYVNCALMTGAVNANKIGKKGVYAKSQEGLITHYCTDTVLRSTAATVADLKITGDVGDTIVNTTYGELTVIAALNRIAPEEEIIIVGAGEGGADLTTTFSEYIDKEHIRISTPLVTAVTTADVKTTESTWVAVGA
jgi:hypothetical protein